MTGEHTPQDDPDDLPPGQARRRPALAFTAVAAAVVLTGGGGAYWASSGAGDPPPGRSSQGVVPAALVLDEPAGAVSPAGQDYRVTKPLPDGPDSAAVHRPQGPVSGETVAKLADALGVPGTAKLADGVWKIIPVDGGGPSLRVDRNAPGDWAFSRSGPPEGCVGTSKDIGGTVPVCPAGPAGGVPSGPVPPVSERRAEEAAAPVFSALGLDDAEIDATGTSGALRDVRGDPVVNGLPTHGWSTLVRVGSDGLVVGGSGTASTLTEGDAYPVIDAGPALENLRAGSGPAVDHGIRQCPPAVPEKSPGTGGADPGPPEILPCVPADAPVLEVRGAVFGLSARIVDGSRALVPAWLFQVAQPGVERTHTRAGTAVEEKYIRRGGAAGEETPGENPGTADPAGPGAVESYSPDGDTLELRFWGGVCSTYTAFAEESGGTVRVGTRAEEKEPGSPCVLVAELFTLSVGLDAPLGDREVVNASDGSAVPKE